MGLNAAVYADDEEDQEIFSARIGNVALIAFLRDEITELGCEASVIREKVLYSGVQSGHKLAFADVEALKHELLGLPAGSQELKQFKHTLLAVCDVTLLHRRPIVF